jgi:arylsulfatase A-like enzyme
LNLIDIYWGVILFGIVIIYSIFKHFYNRSKQACRLNLHQKYLEEVRQFFNILDPDLSRPPNIVIILTDDMGYADISAYGATAISTPNIDQIAREGVSFDTFYSSSPVCSPSRAGLLTGRYPLRMHISKVFFPHRSYVDNFFRITGGYRYGVDGLMADEITLAEALKCAGYRTGILGKWHLGDHSPHLPNEKGFDFFYGSYYSNDMKPYAFYRNRNVEVPAPVDQTQITHLLTREALKFIEENASRPFFLHYCQPFPHSPVHASAEFTSSSRAGTYGDCIQELDWSVGEILKSLDKHNLRNNTLLIFTSDNGPWYEGNPGYVRGRKGLPFEGGQRVPAIWSWLGHMPQNEKRSAFCSNLDIFPTLLNLVNIPLPEDRAIDGRDILPLLMGTQQDTDGSDEGNTKRFFYLWDKRALAVRKQVWKYHRKHMNDNAAYWPMPMGPLLYHLEEDFNESYNQIMAYPEKAEELKKILEQFQHELDTNPRGWK